MRFAQVLVFLVLISAIFSGIPPSGAGSSIDSNAVSSHISGDWTIHTGEAISLDGQTVEIKGNVTVENGASLTLRDGSKLILNSSYDGEYGIYVRSGGSLSVINSNVSGVEKDYRGNISYNLNEGMNYISLPFERKNNSVENALSPFKGRYYKSFAYISDDEDHWKFYSPGYNRTYARELPSYIWKFKTGKIEPPYPCITFPENNSENISVNQDIVVIFDRSMYSNSTPALNVISGTDPGNWEFKGWKSTFSSNDTAVWSHGAFNTSDNLTISLSNFTDLNGIKARNFNIIFQTSESYLNMAVRSSPVFMEDNVNISQNLTLVFRNSIDTSHPPELNQIFPAADLNWNLTKWEKSRRDNDTAVWTHSRFPSDSEIILSVSNYTNITGGNGNTYYLMFHTEGISPPSVKEAYPIPSDVFAPVNADVKIIFDGTMNSSVPIDAVCNVNGVSSDIVFDRWESTYVRNDTAVWSHETWPSFSSISISIDNYMDDSGNNGSIYAWNFTTGDPRTPGIKETYPDNFMQNTNCSGELRVVFNSTMNTHSIPTIEDSEGSSWIFIGWSTTYKEHDTAVWSHGNWTSDSDIRISISNYSDLFNISDKDAIYLYTSSDLSVDISGKVNAEPWAYFYKGWNPVAYPFLDPVDVGSVFSSIRGDYDKIRTYADNGSYIYLNSSDMLMPGRAYWVHTITEKCLWHISAYSLSGLENLFPRFGWTYEEGSSGNIKNSIISGCGYKSESHGGLTIKSDLVKVSYSEFRNGYYGLYIQDSSPIISESSMYDSHYGIVSEGASPILSHNAIFSNKEGGIITIEGFPIIAYNSVYSNDGSGILLYNSTAVLDSNTLAGNRIAGLYSENSSSTLTSQIIKNNDAGIRAVHSNISVSDSSFKLNFRGIHASFSEINITLSDFSNDTYDIYVDNQTSGLVIGNTMSASGRAHILCSSGAHPNIYGNILISGDTGVYVSGASPNITNNMIGQNIASGVHVQNCQNVNISQNTIWGNGWAGVYLENAGALVENNTIYSNDFGVASFGSSALICKNKISGNRWYGASLVYSDVRIENTEFLDNKWYGILSSYSNADIWNSTVHNSTYHLYLTHNSRTDTINSTVDESKVHLDFTSVLYVKYLLKINVTDTLGNRINNASYVVDDKNDIKISSGMTRFGRAEIPLTAYVRTYGGVMDVNNPYMLQLAWDGQSCSHSFYINSTENSNFTFLPKNYTIYEDSGISPIFSISDWFPAASNSSFEVQSPSYIETNILNGTVYVSPEKDWYGIAKIKIYQKIDNSTIWNYTFLLNVIGIDDPPEIMGETPPYASGKSMVFTVVYRDVENEAPEYVRVVIDGHAHDMYPNDNGDTNYIDGRTYTYSADLSPGEHTYHIVISDGNNIVSTENKEINAEYTSDILIYAIYAFLAIGLIIVLSVAYRIRKMKKLSHMDEDDSSSDAAPFALKGSSLDKRRAILKNDAGISIPEEKQALSPKSSIDRAAAGALSSPVDEEKAPAVEDTSAVAVSDKTEAIEEDLQEGTLEDIPKKELKYGHKKYLEMTKKHRKMRVLVEDRDKYKISVEPEEKDISGQEEDVDDILQSIKGD